MRRFQFRLQTLLEVKRRLEEQAQLDLMHQEMVLAGLQSERDYLHQAVLTQRARLEFPPEATLELDEVQQDHRMLEYLKTTLAEKDRQIEGCRQESERLRETLVERKKDRETVEKLRERDYAAWRHEAARLDQSALDEVSSIAFNRRRREAGEVRTWVLFTIMMILVVFLVYVTGTERGRSWIEDFNRKLTELQLPKAENPEDGGAGSEMEEAAVSAEQPEPPPSLESVRRERQRLSRWEAQLQQKQQQVELELVALSEIRDDIASKQLEVDQKILQLKKLLEEKQSEDTQQREEMLNKLAKLYSDTKAKDAARLLMERDVETTVEIIRRMNERDVVKILQEMNKLGGEPGGPSGPERATELLDLYAEQALRKPGS